MTREGAIEYLKWARPKNPYSFDRKNLQEAFDMAITALSQEQQSEGERDHEILKAYADGQESMKGCNVKDEYKRNIEEIAEVMKCDADAETKCRMVNNILNAKPHYFKSQELYEDDKELDFVQPHKKIKVNLFANSDAISREAAIDCVTYDEEYTVECLKALPPVSVAEKVGRWIDGHCSLCGCDAPAYIIDWKWQKDMNAKYCPNCGLRMVELQESEE